MLVNSDYREVNDAQITQKNHLTNAVSPLNSTCRFFSATGNNQKYFSLKKIRTHFAPLNKPNKNQLVDMKEHPLFKFKDWQVDKKTGLLYRSTKNDNVENNKPKKGR